MEQDRPIFRIFIIIMIIEFVATFLGYSRMFLPFTLDNVQYFTIYHFIISIITFIINPISVLIGFYYLGKKLDLKSNLKPVIVRLLIGAYLGQFISITILYLVGIYFIEGFSFYWLSYLSSILSVSFLGLFFASFTALAIANLGQNNRC
jgi:hypothetical protein